MIGGGSNLANESSRLGLPADLLKESESFKYSDGTIYPDNMLPVSVFCDMMTQWRVGINGITGLDYAALPAVLDIRRIKRKARPELFECLQIMERAVLQEVQSRRA